MQKLTKTQAAALALIEDNPRRVEAGTRLRRDMLRINGNMENALNRHGFIVTHEVGVDTRIAYGEQVTATIRAWKLTEAGREALRSTL